MIYMCNIISEMDELSEILDKNLYDDLMDFCNSIINFEDVDLISSKRYEILKNKSKYSEMENSLIDKWFTEMGYFYLNEPGLFNGNIFMSFEEILKKGFIEVTNGKITFFDKYLRGKLVLSPEVLELKDGIFSRCDLTEVVLSDNIKVIPTDCFYCSEKLKKVTLGKNVKDIEERAFGHSLIESIELPEGVEKIENKAFCSCKYLIKAKIPSTVKKLNKAVFFDTGFKSIGKLNSEMDINYHLEIPDTLELICDSAFACCDNLKYVNLPNIKYIDRDIFYLSKPERVVISPSCRYF